MPLHTNMYTHEKEAADGVGVPGRERAAGEKNIGLTMPLRTFAHMRKKLRVGVGVAWRERRREDKDGDFERQGKTVIQERERE